MTSILLSGDITLNVKSKEFRDVKIRFLDLLLVFIVGIRPGCVDFVFGLVSSLKH